MSELPTVSALVAAYNYERYVGRAIESALAQDYPPELLEIVVIDDGSTDGTAAVVSELAERHPQRNIKLVSQRNGGLTAAMNRSLEEATGEVLAILDADDMWTPTKLARSVQTLISRPEVGLVFSDMAIVDADGAPSGRTLLGRDWRLPSEHAFKRLLIENFATASSIVVRASLRDAFAPIPAAITHPDWWFATAVARVAELACIAEPLALYRVHGANLVNGTSDERPLREWRKDLAFQLCCLRELALDTLDARDAAEVWVGVEAKAQKALRTSGTPFTKIVESSAEDQALAASLASTGEEDPHAQARLALRALALDPYGLEYREQLMRARDVAVLPDPLAGSRRFVTLVAAEDLLDDDSLLLAYAAELAGRADATLAIDATRLDASLVPAQLRALIERCGLSGRADVHLLAVVGAIHESQRQRMLDGVDAVYGRDASGAAVEDLGLPRFTPGSLESLRLLAA